MSDDTTIDKEAFANFLTKKKINATTFEAREPERFAEWFALFKQCHVKSFVQQKLFLMNQMRHRYPLVS